MRTTFATTEELQASLNPFTAWTCSTPELEAINRTCLTRAGQRPTPGHGNLRITIYVEIAKNGEPIAWVVGNGMSSRVTPFYSARQLLINNWADQPATRPTFLPHW